MVPHGLMQRRAHSPRARNRRNSKNPEKNSGQLQPQRSRQPHQPSAYRFVELFAALLQPLPRLFYLSGGTFDRLRYPSPGSISPLRIHWRIHAPIRTRIQDRALSRALLCICCRVRRRRGIHGHHQRFSRCPSPNTKRTTKSNRIHTQKCSPSSPARETLRTPNKHRRPFIASNPSRRIASTKELD